MSRKWWWFALAAITLLAIGIRFWQLGTIPSSLYWDEVAMLADAKIVAATGRDMHNRPWFQLIYPSYGDYKLPVYIWLASATVAVAGVSEWALRLPSAVAGVITVLVAGALARELWTNQNWQDEPSVPRSSRFDRGLIVQLMAMLVVAVAPWSILFSRTAFEGHLAQLLVAVSAYLLVKKWSRKWQQVLATVAAALVGGLATYTYFSVRFVWPVVAVLLIIGAVWPAVNLWWQSLAKVPMGKVSIWLLTRLLLPLALFGLCLIPMVRSPLYGDSNRFRLGTDSILTTGDQVMQSNVYRQLAGNSRVDRVFFHRWWFVLQELFKNYADHLDPRYLFLFGDSNMRHGTGMFGLYHVSWLPFLLLGAWWLWRWRPRVLLVLVGWWLIALLPASVPNNTPHALRSLNALVPSSIVIASGAMAALEWLVTNKSRFLSRYKTALLISSVSIVLLMQLPFLAHYFRWYDLDSADAWQDGYREVTQAIEHYRRDDEPVLILTFDDKFYLWQMAYGHYTGAEMKSWPTENYQHHAFDGIIFGANDATKCLDECLLVGTPQRVQQVLPTIPASASAHLNQYQISGRGSAGQYLVTTVRRQK